MPTQAHEDMEAAKAFVATHLVECCQELLTQSDTGVLPDGRMREMRQLCAFAGPHAPGVAENLVKRAALEFVVRNGHAVEAPVAPDPSVTYDPGYGDDTLCVCGHAYYRHFDWMQDNAPVGCKYCDCETFKAAK